MQCIGEYQTMPIIGGAVLLLQIVTIVHALRTGRPYWWIFVIFAFPLLGMLIYYLVEVAPGGRQERALHQIGRDIVKAVTPDRELHRRAEELAICGSVQNKLAMAEECTARGSFDDAIRLYESTREGQYVNAPDLLLGLAKAHFYNGDYPVAHGLLEELITAHPDYYQQDVAILKARAADGSGDRESALRGLEAILERSVGLEARYRYAEILWRNGEPARAQAELKRVLEHAAKFRVSAAEKQWAKLSRKTLASLG
jgi:hypothetical protein